MSTTLDLTTRWTPNTAAERELVLAELNAILSSHHFRNSKRYPALLKYVVSQTLDGHADQLKERTLGVEVFERRPDYDTNADPVVRFSAGEIRKRIAQYYHETGEDCEVQIDLPLGSYVPEFKLRGVAAEGSRPPAREVYPAEPHSMLERAQALPHAAPGEDLSRRPRSRFTSWPWLRWAAVLLLVPVAIGAYSLRRVYAPTVTEKLWAPFLQSSGPVLIVVGSGHPELVDPEPTDTNLKDHMIGPYHHVSMSSAVALSRLVGLVEGQGRGYEIKEGTTTSLTDISSRPVILVGALNNLWTLRLLEPLRYRFVNGTLAKIVDAQDPANRQWAVDFSQPFSQITTDYAIVARYRDTTTNGNVMVIAGIGPYGTAAASDFVASPRYLDQLLKNAPAGWEHKNLEMVLKTDLIAGEPGPPYLVASTVW